jgi:flavin reductase (DIM6/NTAB) family NADH-FMN oxidoreductase RutF
VSDVDVSRLLRRLCGNFPTGVTVVTSLGADDMPRGVTVNSFTSVSLSPPLVLVCIDTRSSSVRSINEGRAFGVHFLTSEQWEWAYQFARPGEGKFDAIEWRRGETRVPLLPQFAVALECELVAEYAGGDHAILVGGVKATHIDEGVDGVLGFFQGRFIRIDSRMGLFREMEDLPSADLLGAYW